MVRLRDLATWQLCNLTCCASQKYYNVVWRPYHYLRIDQLLAWTGFKVSENIKQLFTGWNWKQTFLDTFMYACSGMSFEHGTFRGRRQCFVLICRRSARLKESENRGRGYSYLEETETKPPPTTTGSPDLSYREPLLKRILRWRKYLILILTPILLMPLPIAVQGKVRALCDNGQW